MSPSFIDTIAAQATPIGRGGVGIIRISGPNSESIAKAILGFVPKPRDATHCLFLSENGDVIDQGLALYFPKPHSFTGEDVLELQGHGGPVIMDMLLRRILSLGVRQARPGEFSERAFLNNKMDLAQAEAVADLIDAASEQAAQSAIRSLQGEFSKCMHKLVEKVIDLRMYVEAAIDFPEEEIDFLTDGKVATALHIIIEDLYSVKQSVKQGSLLREGINIVIAGAPNAGKSTLLNQLSGRDAAIVTEIPGTTRDVLREHIQLDGLPLHIIDTAGLCDSVDVIEREGVNRAWHEINNADRVLFVIDASFKKDLNMEKFSQDKLTLIYNKIDLTKDAPEIAKVDGKAIIKLSAKTGAGLDLLKQHLKKCVGYKSGAEGQFSARRRHLDALVCAEQHLHDGQKQLTANQAGELLAEELSAAQLALGEITGEFHSEDLLDRIFSSFCIGK